MVRFTDPQSQAFFDFVNRMEEARYADGYGQTEHARLAFALDAESGQACGVLRLEGAGESGAADAVRMMLEHGYEAAALVQEGYVMPTHLKALMIELHRPDAPVANWGREIVTDKHGKRSLGEIVVNTLALSDPIFTDMTDAAEGRGFIIMGGRNMP